MRNKTILISLMSLVITACGKAPSVEQLATQQQSSANASSQPASNTPTDNNAPESTPTTSSSAGSTVVTLSPATDQDKTFASEGGFQYSYTTCGGVISQTNIGERIVFNNNLIDMLEVTTVCGAPSVTASGSVIYDTKKITKKLTKLQTYTDKSSCTYPKVTINNNASATTNEYTLTGKTLMIYSNEACDASGSRAISIYTRI